MGEDVEKRPPTHPDKNKSQEQKGERTARLSASSPKKVEVPRESRFLKPTDVGNWQTFEVEAQGKRTHVLVPGEYNTGQISIALGFSHELPKGVEAVWSGDPRIRGLENKTNYLGPLLISTNEKLLEEIVTKPPQPKKK